MLAHRGSRLLASRFAPALSRGFCAPVVPLVDQISADLESMKAKLDDKSVNGYADEAAAMAAVQADPSLLSPTNEFGTECRKLSMKLNMQTKLWQKELDKGEVADFSQFEGQLDADIISQVSSILTTEYANAKSNPKIAEDEAEMKKKVAAIYSGPDGVLEAATKEQKAAEAGLLQCIAEMEKLSVDTASVSDVTIAEILEREPELRAEIEEEFKNNVWAP